MANIKITVEGPLMDGHKITFKAPCNCDAVEKLDVRYIEDNTQKSKLFTMRDSHGKDLTGLGNLFFKNAYVNVVLDINNSFAYLQNAGTNSYLEGKMTPVDNLLSDRGDLPLSAKQGKKIGDTLNGVTKFIVDPETGKLTGYTTEIGGADTVYPFKGETAVVQFSTTHNSGANDTGSWTATKTISTGLKVSEIIHVSPLITSLGTRASVKIDSIADNGDITVTMSGGDGSTYGGWYIISTVTLDIVLYKYPEAEIIREYTKTGVTASSAFSGYAYASAADKNKTTHWLPANTDAAPRAIFTFLDPFVLKRIDALFCNTSGNVIEDVSVTISGSNDNKVFEPIQTFGGISLKSFSKVSTDPLESYEINNEKSYKYYMIEFNKAMAGITEAEFFGTLW